MLQGPLASLLLRGLGAEVIRVEPFGGSVERTLSGRGQWVNGRSVLDLVVNRGKRSIALDLKHPRAREIVDPLLESTDVVIHNFRPGAMERLGLGFTDVHEQFPHIVYGGASGYGEDGPYRDRPGQDLLVQALTGMMGINGRHDDPPVPLGSTMVDVHSGTLLALAVCAALERRRETGAGTKVEVDLLAAAIHLQFEPVHYALNSDEPLTRSHQGLADPYHHAPYGVYPTANDYLAISTNDMQALVNCLTQVKAIDISIDTMSPRTFAARDEIYLEIAAVTRLRPSDEWMAIFRPAGVWAEPVCPPGTAVRDDPQVQHRGLIETIGGQAPVQALRIPVETAAAPPASYGPSPRIGGDSRDILGELGFTADEIKSLVEAHVVGVHAQESE